jgi:hypothetical protein
MEDLMKDIGKMALKMEKVSLIIKMGKFNMMETFNAENLMVITLIKNKIKMNKQDLEKYIIKVGNLFLKGNLTMEKVNKE